MRKTYPEPFFSERHQSREQYLKIDRERLCKRLETTDERLTSTKNVLQFILSLPATQPIDLSKRVILEYLIEEKNTLVKRLNKVEQDNKEALLKSAEQKKFITEISDREKALESELSSKYRNVVRDSREKEKTIQELIKKTEAANKEFKELAKSRLNSNISPKNVPELLKTKEQAIIRVIFKVREYSKYITMNNKDLQSSISKSYQDLIKLNSQSKFPFKAPKSLENLKNPQIRNLAQGDIREKLINNIDQDISNKKTSKGQSLIQKLKFKLEEKMIKFESLYNELKVAELINNSLKEDKSNLITTAAHVHQRKGEKIVTYKPNHVDSFIPGHKPAYSNPLDYCLGQASTVINAQTISKPELDLEFSKDLYEFSSVEDRNYDAPEDSLIDEILCLN